ncbi:MAG TPA: hypothetical protein VNJ05_01965 [Sphingomicrobium sp.]|nr:hypothetical protein [Sphingomicrobium sp.]
MIALFALIAAHVESVASLKVTLASGTGVQVQVREDTKSGYRFTVDCLTQCVTPLHFDAPIGDAPMGLVDLAVDGLVYSVWGTGCCYIVRVWQVTASGVKMVLETGSRGRPSLLNFPGPAVETYVRPTDSQGRETIGKLTAVRWTYHNGKFQPS